MAAIGNFICFKMACITRVCSLEDSKVIFLSLGDALNFQSGQELGDGQFKVKSGFQLF
jgi:hypothetical protein